jgi:tripartite-type tricarboxylate transporter receptor subunit TctC
MIFKAKRLIASGADGIISRKALMQQFGVLNASRPARRGRAYVSRLAFLSLTAGALALDPRTAISAQSPPPFYEGKTITILVGAGAGGGYDVNTRLFARYLAKYIPGNPNIVIENMPGAGGIALANTLYNVSPRDGTTLGVFAASVALEPTFGDVAARYKASGFKWLGSLERDTPSCGVWKGAGQNIKTLDDLVHAKREVIFGSTSPSATTSQHALLLKHFLGAPIKVIYGFQGQSDTKLALERGEIDGICGLLESTIRSTFLSSYKDGDLKVLVQFNPTKSVPFFDDAERIYDRAKTAEDHEVLDVIFKQAELARPFAAPPGVPMERVELLRKAILQAAQDPDLKADARTIGVDFNPVSGAETQKIFAEYESVPKTLIDRAIALTSQK